MAHIHSATYNIDGKLENLLKIIEDKNAMIEKKNSEIQAIADHKNKEI